MWMQVNCKKEIAFPVLNASERMVAMCVPDAKISCVGVAGFPTTIVVLEESLTMEEALFQRPVGQNIKSVVSAIHRRTYCNVIGAPTLLVKHICG